MAQYTKQLHFLRNGTQNDIKLYTSLSDVVDVDINTDGTTGGITLYTSTSDVEYPYLRVMDGDTPVYAALELLTAINTSETGLKVSGGGNTYVVKKEALPAKGKSSYTPEEIKKILNAGKHTEYFNVGDSFPVTLNGTVGKQTFSNQKFYATILGFDHNKATETGGKNSVHFIFGKNEAGTDIAFCDFDGTGWSTGSDAAFRMNLSNTTTGGWKESYMKKTICPQFLAAMPSEWQSIIGTVTKYTDNTGGSTTGANQVTATQEKIFLLSEFEVHGTKTYANESEKNSQQQYAYYANGNSKIRKNHRDGSTAVDWWLRSVNAKNTTIFCIVGPDGSADRNHAFYSLGFAPCFTIVAD